MEFPRPRREPITELITRRIAPFCRPHHLVVVESGPPITPVAPQFGASRVETEVDGLEAALRQPQPAAGRPAAAAKSGADRWRRRLAAETARLGAADNRAKLAEARVELLEELVAALRAHLADLGSRPRR
jgi:hypothetical protein